MAYKTTVSKYCANRQVALDEIYSQMSAMGWTLVDGNFTSITVAYTAVSIANDTFTVSSGSVPADATPCQITSTGTLPGGLAINKRYYVVSGTDTTFKLSATYNGAAINITTQGTGNHTIKEALRIYKSNGENSDKIYEYIFVNAFSVATTIYFWPIYYWNTTTKSIVGQVYTGIGPDVTTSESGFYLWVYGNKDLVLVATRIGSTYDKMIFGHMNKTLNTLVTTTTSNIESGTGVPVAVASTVGFDLTTSYQIIGANGEGRDQINLNSIDSPTQFTATSIARSYASGAYIGVCPSTFGCINGGATQNWYFTCPLTVVGTSDAAANSYGLITGCKDILGVDPDYRSNRYLLQPIWLNSYMENNNTYISTGYPYNDAYLLYSPTTGLTQEDTFSFNILSTGVSTGTNDATTLNDTSQTWVTNTYAGKVVIITGGIGVGQIKKIASNTNTALTLDTGWIFEVVPTTSTYVICEEGYRYLFSTTGPGIACREGC